MIGALSRQDIYSLIKQKPPLVESYINLDEQVQTNGFDLTLRDICMMQEPGQIAVSNDDRLIPELVTLAFDKLGYINLRPGSYTITYNEVVHLPKGLMALATPRSSLLRCGVAVHTAVWDAGYSGRSQSLMVVYNPKGFRLQQNARVVQLVFFSLTGSTEGYAGKYQGENIGK